MTEEAKEKTTPSGLFLDGQKVYKLVFDNKNSHPSDWVYFREQDIDMIKKLVADTIVGDMLGYGCSGCRYCCYGTQSCRERCEMSFNNKSELPKYREFCKKFDIQAGASIYRLDCDLIPKPYDAPGYDLKDFEDEIWSAEEDESFWKTGQVTLKLS